MSSLRLALRLSLQESHAPNTSTAAAATPVKGKKAALRIVTPEKENVPPAAARRKETLFLPSTVSTCVILDRHHVPSTPTLTEY
jgi:hypothetical protein